MKLTQKEKEFIAAEYASGDSFEDIAFTTGLTVQAVKRALADMQVIDLSWHKAKHQHDLLTLLRENGIHTVSDIRKYRLELR